MPFIFMLLILKNFEKIHKNREKNLQIFSVNDFKIQCRVFEIKFNKMLKLYRKIGKCFFFKVAQKILEKII